MSRCTLRTLRLCLSDKVNRTLAKQVKSLGYNFAVSDQNLIPDVNLLDLKWDGDRLVFLREDDHLLRRFGQVEVRRIKKGQITPFSCREVADEIWAVFSGQVVFTLIDKREKSPSENQTVEFFLDEGSPQALLVPFGVAYAIQTEQDSQLIRLTTHLDGTHPGDKTFPFEELVSRS